MNNRLALVGSLLVALAAAQPSVASAQGAGTNPWRSAPHASGQYAPVEGTQALQVPQYSQPKYAPLDGKLPDDKKTAPRPAPWGGYVPPVAGGLNGPGMAVLGYGVPVYDGFGYPGLGYPGAGYLGGYPGTGYSGLGYPGGWGGLGPLSGWNGIGGPSSWMPFW